MDRLNPLLTRPNPTFNSWVISNLELSGAQVVSPPTSIRNWEGMEGWANYMPDGEWYPIPMGQFTWWSYFTPPARVELAFRIQPYPEYPLSPAYYYLTYHSWGPTAAYRYEAPTSTLIGLFDYVPTPLTWEHLLLLWAPSCAFDATPAFEILLMKEMPWGWHGQGVAFDPLDKWRASPQNQFAFNLETDELGAHCYFDDTRLYSWDGSIIHT